MRSFLFISAVCLQMAWSYGAPEGVGAYAYQDSAGNSVTSRRFFPDYLEPLSPFPPLPVIPPLPPLVPQTFLPQLHPFHPLPFPQLRPWGYLEPIRTFRSNFENQKLALNAASKAFDLTSNHAGYIPNFPRRFPFNNFPGFGGFPTFPNFDMSNFGNSAFAGGAAGPGFTHQIAAINPANPQMPNVDVMSRFADTEQKPGSNFVSMSSHAYSVSSNVNGKEFKDRGAETTVNNNGKVTTYRVKS
ncbi:uncharacterized protein LOC131843425 isoform X2 [Achroia grisella]|uniref:uncharacterized protein LOC131843425 isoform X2 n=1 Tax=Achroia grisella TaxID=688607 RepID=UPI0027D33BEB|nr:uncharacterized protein LOC131843425 isoform X2 [Achroia grisella]